jgi:hypothetical protein
MDSVYAFIYQLKVNLIKERLMKAETYSTLLMIIFQ